MLKTHGYDVSSYGWVPLVSFSFTLFLAYWGVLSLPFVVIAEILPEKVKIFEIDNFLLYAGTSDTNVPATLLLY